jgi:hypothetical protein
METILKDRRDPLAEMLDTCVEEQRELVKRLKILTILLITGLVLTFVLTLLVFLLPSMGKVVTPIGDITKGLPFAGGATWEGGVLMAIKVTYRDKERARDRIAKAFGLQVLPDQSDAENPPSQK